jgi:hypothetical protein
VVVPAGTAADQASNGKAALRVASAAPLKIRGLHFRASERVVVKVIAPKGASARVRADRTGRFGVSFPTVTYDRCSGLLVVATGARGSRATLKRPQPACPPGP